MCVSTLVFRCSHEPGCSPDSAPFIFLSRSVDTVRTWLNTNYAQICSLLGSVQIQKLLIALFYVHSTTLVLLTNAHL